MPPLDDIARTHARMHDRDLDHLRRLTLHWHLLSDLSFADLVLWLPDAEGAGYWAGAQIRPTTSSTAFADDLVGSFVERDRRPLIEEAFRTGRLTRDGTPEWRDETPVRVETIPVHGRDRVIAVIARTTTMRSIRRPSTLEVSYLEAAGDLAQMISAGRFPTPDSDAAVGRRSPRAGDGFAHLDADGVVRYVSPNALSAFRRLGLAGDLAGRRLVEVATDLVPPDRQPVEEALEHALSGRAERSLDLDSGHSTIALRIVPLDPGGQHHGAIALMRDISDLRQRERELLSREATIREIHHRVKNNLQTVAALLRMQSRRTPEESARLALEEATRRVGSVAVVHELLSRSLSERVDFDQVLDRLIAMVHDVSSARGSVRIVRSGSVGQVGAETATTLAVALTELLANAIEHGVAGRGDGSVEVFAGPSREGGEATAGESGPLFEVGVLDDGPGLPDGLDPATTSSLGLRIVRTLAEAELAGTFELGPRTDGTAGTAAVVRWPRRVLPPER